MKRVMRFEKKRKLNSLYVGPYLIVKHIGEVVYKLDLPNEFGSGSLSV